MSGDAESDTRSPWFDVFAVPTQPNVPGMTDETRQTDLRLEPVEPEWPAEALFDCYNA